MTDTRNPVPPIEGHYAMLRNGQVYGPLQGERPANGICFVCVFSTFVHWNADGQFINRYGHRDNSFDIIATISPEAMHAAASGKVERLRAENKQMLAFVEKVAAGAFRNMVLPSYPPKDAAQYHARQTLNDLTKGGSDDV